MNKGNNMEEMMMTQTYLTLNDGTRIPQFGMGVYMVPEGKATYNAVTEALKMGYRHIDTAHAYQNERSVGKAVKDSGIARKEIWITTKLWPSEYGEGKTMAAIDKMLSRLDTEYIDLLLLHQQFGDYLGAWRDMEKAVASGKVRSIGISNFESERLEEICEAATIKPSVLQVECHPYYQQNALKKRLAPYGTVIESWYPIGHGDPALINEAD
ncbi:MAG: aldo/keto reductase [Lachnospiraceae bacterium]|nr:aldo/keto reductase [Lachnospiraceae bacterium]